jgi:hypothetical protein
METRRELANAIRATGYNNLHFVPEWRNKIVWFSVALDPDWGSLSFKALMRQDGHIMLPPRETEPKLAAWWLEMLRSDECERRTCYLKSTTQWPPWLSDYDAPEMGR